MALKWNSCVNTWVLLLTAFASASVVWEGKEEASSWETAVNVHVSTQRCKSRQKDRLCQCLDTMGKSSFSSLVGTTHVGFGCGYTISQDKSGTEVMQNGNTQVGRQSQIITTQNTAMFWWAKNFSCLKEAVLVDSWISAGQALPSTFSLIWCALQLLYPTEMDISRKREETAFLQTVCCKRSFSSLGTLYPQLGKPHFCSLNCTKLTQGVFL